MELLLSECDPAAEPAIRAHVYCSPAQVEMLTGGDAAPHLDAAARAVAGLDEFGLCEILLQMASHNLELGRLEQARAALTQTRRIVDQSDRDAAPVLAKLQALEDRL